MEESIALLVVGAVAVLPEVQVWLDVVIKFPAEIRACDLCVGDTINVRLGLLIKVVPALDTGVLPGPVIKLVGTQGVATNVEPGILLFAIVTPAVHGELRSWPLFISQCVACQGFSHDLTLQFETRGAEGELVLPFSARNVTVLLFIHKNFRFRWHWFGLCRSFAFSSWLFRYSFTAGKWSFETAFGRSSWWIAGWFDYFWCGWRMVRLSLHKHKLTLIIERCLCPIVVLGHTCPEEQHQRCE